MKIINGFQLLTIFAKSSILDVWKGSEYASGDRKQSRLFTNVLKISSSKNSKTCHVKITSWMVFSLVKFLKLESQCIHTSL